MKKVEFHNIDKFKPIKSKSIKTLLSKIKRDNVNQIVNYSCKVINNVNISQHFIFIGTY